MRQESSRRKKRRMKAPRWWLNVQHRWTNTMPKFFRVICYICALVSGTALAVNTAIVDGGGVPHEWWVDIYPYLLGIPAGAAFVAKFTQTYGKDGKPIEGKPQEPESGNTILDKDNF